MEDLSLHVLDLAENSLAAGATEIRITVFENPPDDKLVIVRLEGTNKEQGLQVLAASHGDIQVVESIAGGVRVMTARRSMA